MEIEQLREIIKDVPSLKRYSITEENDRFHIKSKLDLFTSVFLKTLFRNNIEFFVTDDNGGVVLVIPNKLTI